MTNYTQRQWDRTVGWGKVPDEYNSELSTNNTDGQDSKGSEKTREEILATVKRVQDNARRYGW